MGNNDAVVAEALDACRRALLRVEVFARAGRPVDARREALALEREARALRRATDRLRPPT